MKYVVICEKAVDAPLAISNLSGGTIKFIAASPEACKGLDTVNIKYTDIEGYFPPDICNTDECYDKIYAMCGDIDIQNPQFSPGKDNFYFIKMLYDALHIRTIALKNIIKKERPDKLVVFADDKTTTDFNYPFSDSESIYALLLKSAFKVDYQVITRPEKKNVIQIDTKEKREAKKEVKKERKVPPHLYGVAYCFKHHGFFGGVKATLYMIRNRLRGKKVLIAMSKYNYSWNTIMMDLYKNGYDVVLLDISGPGGSPDITVNLDAVKKYCVVDEIDFSDVFLNVLKRRTDKYDETKSTIKASTERAIKKYKPYAFIGATKTYVEHIISRTAAEHFVPVVTWQHGAAYPPSYSRMIPFNEMMGSDIHFSFGDGYKGFKKTFGCQIVPVGSTSLYDIIKIPAKKRPSIEYDILYVTTNYNWNKQYSGANTDNKLWKAQKAILDLLMQYPSLRIAIKLHPKSDASHPMLKHIAGKENIKVFIDEPFTDILMKSSSVIVDWPSTTMLAALAADKDVFVLSDQIALTDEQKTMLKKRVVFAESLDEFIPLLRDHIMVPQSHENIEFLVSYGIDQATPPKNEVIKALKNVKKIGII